TSMLVRCAISRLKDKCPLFVASCRHGETRRKEELRLPLGQRYNSPILTALAVRKVCIPKRRIYIQVQVADELRCGQRLIIFIKNIQFHPFEPEEFSRLVLSVSETDWCLGSAGARGRLSSTHRWTGPHFGWLSATLDKNDRPFRHSHLLR